MRHRNVGGRKRKAWRLKKKYDKWFFKVMYEITHNVIQSLPKAFFGDVFNHEDYEFVRFYK